MEAFTHITDSLYKDLYDPLQRGVVVLKTGFDEDCLTGIRTELKENQRNFIQRPYRYGTTVQGLSSWDFEQETMNNYTYLKRLKAFYDRLSYGLHERMFGKEFYYELLKINASYYQSGSVGIGPHKDNSFSVNFVAIFIVSGCNEFFTAREKSGADEVALPVVPGDCVLMRGPRNQAERSLRPIHYVKEIREDRYIVTFREISRYLASQTNKLYSL